MKFELTVQVELPFVLNLDSRSFSVVVAGGRSIELAVDNDAHLVRYEDPGSPQGSGMLIGSLADLAAILKVDTSRLFATKLRTVVRSSVEREVDAAALPAIADAELPSLVMSALVKGGAQTSPEALREQAEQLLQQMSTEQKEAFRLSERQRKFGQYELGHLQDDYLVALNRVIRWYSVDCSDFFVEEVGLHQLAATTTRGVLRTITVDGRLVETIPFVGKVPPLVTQVWMRHPATTITTLEAHLGAADDPDFARVLIIRARHLLERTALRNAIAEAAASLEIAVARAIRKAMKAKHKSDADVDTELKKTRMDFPSRAEATLKTWCTRGVLELDSALWTHLKTDRTQFRNAVVHSDREPSQTDAKHVVDRFIKMTELVLANC